MFGCAMVCLGEHIEMNSLPNALQIECPNDVFTCKACAVIDSVHSLS